MNYYQERLLSLLLFRARVCCLSYLAEDTFDDHLLGRRFESVQGEDDCLRSG
jgi:hypothetical protein